MEEQVFYASDDRSSIELIEQEFAFSQARARELRADGDARRCVNRRTAQVVIIMVCALIILALLTAAVPDMR